MILGSFERLFIGCHIYSLWAGLFSEFYSHVSYEVFWLFFCWLGSGCRRRKCWEDSIDMFPRLSKKISFWWTTKWGSCIIGLGDWSGKYIVLYSRIVRGRDIFIFKYGIKYGIWKNSEFLKIPSGPGKFENSAPA